MDNDTIVLELTRNEAIVLFEFLGRFNHKDHKELFEDQAEQRVLWDIEAILEKHLSESFRQDYSMIIAHAREAVRDKE